MDDEVMDALAHELAAACPPTDMPQGSVADLGGIWPRIQALKDALAVYDAAGTAVAFRDLLTFLIGDGNVFAPAAQTGAPQRAGINWSGLISVLQKLLPLILDAFGGGQPALALKK